jgi:3-oxoacyl-[acyl-carrier-protein] synthase II
MQKRAEVTITGIGVVSPIGIGCEAYWSSLEGQRSGIDWLTRFDPGPSGVRIAGQVSNFEPTEWVRPRKSLKVMSRDIQLAYAAAEMARTDARLESAQIPAERVGVVFGAGMIQCLPDELATAFRSCAANGSLDFTQWGSKAFPEMFPLWLLKYLPNMPACHVAIAIDARGPNNTVTLGEASSLLAVCEAVRLIERGHADVIYCGGASSQINPVAWVRRDRSELCRHCDDPRQACRPFDGHRTGMVHGEGAAVFVMESREHARARGVRPLATILGYGCGFSSPAADRRDECPGWDVAMKSALATSGISADEIGHVNAEGLSTRHEDRIEAQAIRRHLGDVPVTAPKCYFGNLGAGTGAVELVASVLSLSRGLIPATLNYRFVDPECPVKVVRDRPMETRRPTALVTNRSQTGQTVAIVIARD